MSCPDLCTAAKCEELEARINALEQALELLKAAFEAHVSQDIPEAHNYIPDSSVSLFFNDGILEVFLGVDGRFTSDRVAIALDTFVAFDIFPIEDNRWEFVVTVNGDSDSDVLIVELPEEKPPSNLQIDGSFESDILTISVADGESQDTAQIEIPLPEPTEYSSSNLRISASYFGDILTISVADGESTDTAQVFIDSESTTFIVNEGDPVNCDNLSNDINNISINITQEIQDCCNQILSALDQVLNRVNAVEQEVTIDISGTTKTNYQCDFESDNNDNIIPGYAVATFEDLNYQGTGLSGIHEALKVLNSNLANVYTDVRKSIDPISSLSVNDLYQYCRSSLTVDRSLYFDEEEQERYTGASDDYEAAVDAALNALLAETKYAYLINNATGDRLIEAPSSWITPLLADFALIQSRINNDAICNIEIPEDPEVVSIVASDRYLARASGKFLVLHFVTPDNYPKRSRNSTYWQVQIPAAQEESFYDWCAHFENLRWSRGNCYAELKFNQFSNPVSGFFLDKAAADSYFDSVLTLTTATEKNRVYHEHKTPGTSVIERVTRPYRAFIESVNDAGQVICHIKYVPAINPPCQ